ncbi:MAG: hypothetical protein ACJATN_002061 [Neolewinella sp.]|jgi:hypothetical protein
MSIILDPVAKKDAAARGADGTESSILHQLFGGVAVYTTVGHMR